MKVLLLLLSLSGFFLFFRWFRKDLHPSFYPALTVSTISTITCLGGIVGALAWTAGVLQVLGILSFFVFGVSALRKGKRKIESDTAFFWMLGTFLAFCAGAWFLLRNRFIYHYDDFSHWALVVKTMLQESRLPNSADGLMFPSYPLGSASFLYFCCRVLGTGAETGLVAQGVMLISFLLSLQSVAGKEWKGFLLSLAVIPWFAFYNTPLDGLSVDNLLGAAFMAALLLFLQCEHDVKQRLPELMIILSGCVLLKNSGAFLTLGLCIPIAVQLIREKRKVSFGWLWFCVPLLVYLSWRFHLKTGFSDFGKHYMSLYTYYGTFRAKMGEMGQLLRIILPVMVSPRTNHALLLIPAFVLVYLATEPEKKEGQKRSILICAVLFVLYEIGVIVMYLCSMGSGELYAQQGGDFPRYNGTIICALAGTMIYLISKAWPGKGNRRTNGRSLLLLAGLALLTGCMSMNMTRLEPLEKSRAEYPDAYALSRKTEHQSYPADREVAVVFQNQEVSDYELYMTYYYLYPAKNIRCYGAEMDAAETEADTLLIDLREE